MRRFHQPDGRFVADAIYEIDHRVREPCTIVDLQTEQETEIPANTEHSNLLVPILCKGELAYQVPNLAASREHTRQQLSRLPAEVARLDNPRAYPVGLEKSLYELRSTLIAQAKELQGVSAKRRFLESASDTDALQLPRFRDNFPNESADHR